MMIDKPFTEVNHFAVRIRGEPPEVYTQPTDVVDVEAELVAIAPGAVYERGVGAVGGDPNPARQREVRVVDVDGGRHGKTLSSQVEDISVSVIHVRCCSECSEE